MPKKIEIYFTHRRLSRHSLATADLPMGKKNKSLRVLCVSCLPRRSFQKRSRVVKIALIFIVISLFPSPLSAKREHPEKWYQQKWCEEHSGQVEVVLPDGTRCDCVTDTHAIEFDFGTGWAEAIGQGLHYSLLTEKKAGIVLILETIKDRKYWIRMNTTIEHHNLPIETWNIGNASY